MRFRQITNKTIVIFSIVFLVVYLIFLFASESPIKQIVEIVFYVLCAVGICLIVVWLIALRISVIAEDNKFNESVKRKDYNEAIYYFEDIMRVDNGLRKDNTQMYLLKLYMYSEQYEKAKRLLSSAKWVTKYNETFYIKALLALYEKNIAKAQENYKQLLKVKNKKFALQKDVLTKIMEYVKYPNEANKFYELSQYNLAKIIYETYAINPQFRKDDVGQKDEKNT